MTGYPGWTPGVDIFGQGGDSEPVAAEFAHLFPDTARQAPGGVEQEKRTLVYDGIPAPGKGKKRKKRPPPKRVKQ